MNALTKTLIGFFALGSMIAPATMVNANEVGVRNSWSTSYTTGELESSSTSVYTEDGVRISAQQAGKLEISGGILNPKTIESSEAFSLEVVETNLREVSESSFTGTQTTKSGSNSVSSFVE